MTIDMEEIIVVAKEAGDAIMEIYRKDFAVAYKDDKSPLTQADIRSNEIICRALEKSYPDIPLLSEESKAEDCEVRKYWKTFWLIDPIDGTKEFIRKNGEFTVNIALIHNNEPVLGVVYAPALKDMYAAKKGIGAYKNGHKLPLEINTKREKNLRVVASKSHLSRETEAFIDALAKTTEEVKQISRGSSLKLAMVAEGTADIYPRLAPTMEWDTAAADVIVREAGGVIYRYDVQTQRPILKPLVYNKCHLINPWFVACRECAEVLLAIDEEE